MPASYPTLAGLSYPIPRRPTFNTARYESMSGKRTSSPKQAFPRWRYELPYSFLRSRAYGSDAAYQELETLIGFFNSRSADGLVFAYEDIEDKTATLQAFGAGDGVTTEFQLYRAYGGFVEPVYSAAVTLITAAAVPVPDTDYTVSDTGVVTFDVAPADTEVLLWTGTFKWLCRFDGDALDVQNIMKGLWEMSAPLAFSTELNP